MAAGEGVTKTQYKTAGQRAGLGGQEQRLLERRRASKLWGQNVCQWSIQFDGSQRGGPGVPRLQRLYPPCLPSALPGLQALTGLCWGELVCSALTFPTPCLELQSLGDSPDPPPEVFLVFPCGLFPRTEDQTQFCPRKQSTESWKLSLLLMQPGAALNSDSSGLGLDPLPYIRRPCTMPHAICYIPHPSPTLWGHRSISSYRLGHWGVWRLTREGVGGLLRPEASTSWLGQVVNMPFKQARPPGGEKWGRIRLESGCQSHRVSLLSYKWSRVEKASMCNNFGDIVCSKCISKVSINDWQGWLNAYLTHSDFPGGTSGKRTCLSMQEARKAGSIPGLGRSWSREWQPTPVFLPGESPWTEEPGGLQSMGSQRFGHDLSDLTHTYKSLVKHESFTF